MTDIISANALLRLYGFTHPEAEPVRYIPGDIASENAYIEKMQAFLKELNDQGQDIRIVRGSVTVEGETTMVYSGVMRGEGANAQILVFQKNEMVEWADPGMMGSVDSEPLWVPVPLEEGQELQVWVGPDGHGYWVIIDENGKPVAYVDLGGATVEELSGENGNERITSLVDETQLDQRVTDALAQLGVEDYRVSETETGGWELRGPDGVLFVKNEAGAEWEYFFKSPEKYINAETRVFDLKRALTENKLLMITELDADGNEVRRINMEAYQTWMRETIIPYYEANKDGMGVAEMMLDITTGGRYIYAYDGWHLKLTCVKGAGNVNVIGAASLADGSYVVVIADKEHVLPIHIVPGVNHKISPQDIVSPEEVIAEIAGKLPIAYFSFFFTDSNQINLAFDRRGEMDPDAMAILEAWLIGKAVDLEALNEVIESLGGVAKVWNWLKNEGSPLELVDGYKE